ncbi:MAG TPA: cysteine rich repeat-containing protein [Hyphomicrobium sp.]|nr:cysteine rich repeat-containing protein [Hyphomicrobium sp.]
MTHTPLKILALAFATVATATAAGAQGGPVATACKDDIAKYCAGKEHGQGEVRACLEANKDKVSAACKTALDTTGPGKGRGRQ